MLREFPADSIALALGALVLGNAFAVSAIPERAALTVFDTGKGRAALLEADGARILIDTGSDASMLRELGTALPPWARGIDAVFLTGSKGNGGLAAVEGRYKITDVVRLGADVPYGSLIAGPGTALVIEAPGRFSVGSLPVSSTTPPGLYRKW